MKETKNTCQTMIRTGIEEFAELVEQEISGLICEKRGSLHPNSLFRYQWIARSQFRTYIEHYLLLPLERSKHNAVRGAYARLLRLAAIINRCHPGYRWLSALERSLNENGIHIETAYFSGGLSASKGHKILIRPFMTVRDRFHCLIIEYVWMKLNRRTQLSRYSAEGEARAQAVAFAVARAVGLERRCHSRFFTIGRCGTDEMIRRDRRFTTAIASTLLQQMIRHSKA